MAIVRVGRSLAAMCRDLGPGKPFPETFAIERPESRSPPDGVWLRRHLDQLFILRHRASGIQFRGEWLAGEGSAATFIFVGSPWLTHPDQLKEHGLNVGDFAIHDPMVDLLQMAQAQQVAFDDVKQLAAKLTHQRTELRTVNQQLAEQNAVLVATERRLREREAEASKLALVAARTTNAIVVTDAVGRIEWVNQAFSRLTGYELDEVRGRTPGSMLQGSGTDEAAVREMRELLRQGDGFEKDILNHNKAGQPYIAHIEVQPIRDDQGKVTNFMSVQSDVTERVQSDLRRTLRETISRVLVEADSLRAGLEPTIEAIARALGFQVGVAWEVSRGGTTLEHQFSWQRGAEALGNFLAEMRTLAFRQGEGLPGRVWQENKVCWIDDVRRQANFSRAAVAAQAGLVRTIALPVQVDGEVAGVLEFFGAQYFMPDKELPRFLQEVGDKVGLFVARLRAQDALRLAAEAAEAANRAKSDFLATVSHEIRTPMNAVLGMTSLLRETPLDPRQLEFVGAVQTSSESLLAIIDDILDFSKIESNKVTLAEQDFDLTALIEGLLDLLAPRAHDKGLELTALIDPAVPRGVKGDDGRLRQILVNLLGNGIKFTSAGEVVLRVVRAANESEGLRLRFTVTDTGIGIPSEQQQAVFEPFVQVDNTSARRFEGTGLGLTISKRLVQLLGGEMGLESRSGEGSAFWFTIPLLASGQTPLAPSVLFLANVRALVLDNHAAACEGLIAMLRPWGLRLETASRPAEAMERLVIALAQGDPFKIVLIDSRSMGESGQQIAARFAGVLGGARPRLVLLTRTSEAAMAALPEGVVDARIAKPIKAANLFDALFLVVTGQSPPASGGAAIPAGWPAENDLRILVVEDREINQRYARLMLERLGYRADFAVDGREAVAAAQRAPYDVIFMDCQMPVMDGYEATREIRRNEALAPPELRRRARIIAMTANAISDNRRKCFAAGMDDFISKPVRIELVRETLGALRPAAADQAGRAAPVLPFASVPPESEVSIGTLRTEFGDAAAAEMLAMFLNDTPERISELARLREKEDRGNLARAVHMLAGSCGIFGLTAMRLACLQIEERCARGGPGEIAATLRGVAQEFTAVRPALERRLRELSARPSSGD